MRPELFDFDHLFSNSLAIRTLATSISVICLGIYALIRERGGRLSVAFSLVTLAMASWLFCFSWMYSAADEQAAFWWARHAYIGVGFIPAAVYYYGRLLSGDAGFNRWTTGVFIISLIFTIAIISTDMLFNSLYHYSWGYYPNFRLSSAPFLAYFFGIMLHAIRQATTNYQMAVTGSILQARAKMVLISFVGGYIASFDFLASWGVPLYPFGYIPILFFIVLSGFAILRYRLLSITPAIAANKIIATMHDALIVLDAQGIIRLVNEAACRLFNHREQDLLGKHPMSIMTRNVPFSEVLKACIRGSILANHEISFKTAEGNAGALSLTTSCLEDPHGGLLGVVCVVRDISEHRRADEELRQSLSLLQATLESTADGLLVVDSAGRISSFNSRFIKMWRLPEDIVASRDDQRALEFAVEQVKDGKAFVEKVQELYDQPDAESFDLIHLKDGRIFERYSKPQRIGLNPVGRVWSFRDITERKQAEESLQASEHRMRRAEVVASFGNWEFVIGENRVNASDGARVIYGLGTDEWSISDVQKIPLPEYRAMLDRTLADLIERGKPYNVEFKILRPTDGKIIDIQALAEYDPVNKIVFGVIQDMTERVAAADALRKSEEKYRTLFEESKDVIFVSTPDGKYLDINPAGMELFGYHSRDEILSLDITRDVYVSAEDRQKFQQQLNEKGFVRDYEIDLKRKDGKKLTFLSTVTAVRNKAGEIVEYRGMRRDITEYKRLEQQLLQAQKMEAVGQLAGGVAHDFNNILSAIIGYCYILREKIGRDDHLRDDVDQILDSANRAAEVTRNLLAFSRKQIINIRPVSVNEIIRKVERLLSRLIGEDIDVITELGSGVILCMADSGQIEQVLMNLATNARDAMPYGGRFTIRSEVRAIDESFINNYGFGKTGSYALISVSDTGAGMRHEDLEKIFEPFYTTKELGKGTGLGLAMAYGIIKQHDGYITVQSNPGEGTTFSIYLPAATSERKDSMKPALDLEPARGTETVLIAEDDEKLRKLSEIILTESGYKVLLARDGDEAVAKFSSYKDGIQLVMLDMIMPKKSGKEVYDEIRKIRPGVKVLFLSGYAADKLDQRLSLEGNINMLTKPISPRNLLMKIREILDKQPEQK